LLNKKGGANYDAEGNKIINLGTPTDSTDAANKGYVDQTIDNSIALGGSPAIVSLGGYDVTALGTSVTRSLADWTNDLATGDLEVTATGSTTARSLADRFADVVNVLDFIPTSEHAAIKDGTTTYDATDDIQAALDAAVDSFIYMPKGNYKITSELTVKGGIEGDNAVILPYGSSLGGSYNSVLNQTKQGHIRGVIIDGTNCTSVQNGLFSDFGLYEQTKTSIYEMVVKNLSNSNTAEACRGVIFYRASGATLNSKPRIQATIEATDITASADSVGGNAGGSARGINVSFNSTGATDVDAHVHLKDCIVRNVSCGPTDPDEDSDGIVLFYGAFTDMEAQGEYVISNAQISGCKKRGIKIQVPNATVENCIVDGNGCTESFSTYAVKTTFKNCKSVNATNASFATQYKHTSFIDCYAEQTGSDHTYRIYADAENTIIKNCKAITTTTFSTTDLAALYIQSDSTLLDVDGFYATNSNNTGSGIRLQGSSTASKVFIKNSYVEGFANGIQNDNAISTIDVSDSYFSVSNHCFIRTGTSGGLLFVRNSKITATGIAFLCYQSAGASQQTVDIDGCRISSSGGAGIYMPDDSRVANCVIDNGGNTSGEGIRIFIGSPEDDCIIRGNQITGFNYGFDIRDTTITEFANNVSIGAGTAGFNTTGYTAFVDHDNYSR